MMKSNISTYTPQMSKRNRLFVFKDEVIPEKVSTKKSSKSTNAKKEQVGKTARAVSPRDKLVSLDPKTLLSKKQSCQGQQSRFSPRRMNTVDDEQFVIACQPQLFPQKTKKANPLEAGHVMVYPIF